MSRPNLAICTLVLIVVTGWAAPSARAQSSGLFGSTNNAFSATSTRPSGGTSGETAFNRGLSSGFTGPQLSGADQLGALSQQVGQGPFIGGSDNLGRFVGNERAGTQSASGSGPRFVRGGGGAGGFNAQNRQSTPTNQPVVRPQLRIDFTYPTRARTSVSTNLSRVLQRYPAEHVVGEPLDVVVNPDGTVVVSGTVRSEKAAALAVAMVRLEPGVRDVVNELKIAEEPAPPASPQP